jgi:hypothetical protein
LMVAVAILGFVGGGAIVIVREGKRSALRARAARFRTLADESDTFLRGLKEGNSPVSCRLFTRRPRSLRRCDPNPR